MNDTPIYTDLADANPAAIEAMARKPWNYADALAAADKAIAARKPAKKAAKRAPRKAAS